MKWIGISGSWRLTTPTIEEKVREVVRGIILRGDGIVTGGALNVDYFATDEALKHDPYASRIRVYIPTTLEIYAAHYRQRAREEIITMQQAEDLIAQLTALRRANPQALIENFSHTVVNMETYYERITSIVNASDELIAFQVNMSSGVQDTIEKARKKGIPVQLFTYAIDAD